MPANTLSHRSSRRMPTSSPSCRSSPSRHPTPTRTSSPRRTSSPVASEVSEVSHDKRPRSPAAEALVDDRTTYHKKKLFRKSDPEILHNSWGRTLARLFDAYTKPQTILRVGLMFESAIVQGRSTKHFSEAQHAQYHTFKIYTAHLPALDELLDDPKALHLERLSREIQAGQDGACSDDTSQLKRQVIDILQETDPDAAKGLKRTEKSTRGFNHPLTGRLLCPVNLDFEDREIRQRLESGEYKLTNHDSWPAFFYKDSTHNPDDGFEGLLRSDLILQCYKAVFFGGSSWDKRDGLSRSTRAPKAVLAGMDQVTTRYIAYITAFVYQALSSRENNQKIGGGLELSRLYWQVVELLEDPDLKEECDELLEWWNQRIFPSKASTRAVDEVTQDPVAKLKAQKAAKKVAALHDSTNN